MLEKIKILFVRDTNSCNTPYLLYCLYYLKKLFLVNFTEVEIGDYLEINQSPYDVVVYATFPDEEAPQFNKFRAIIPQTDEKFLKFERIKILFDTHANGSTNGFPRLNDCFLPRIKTAPHQAIIQKLNIIFPFTYPIGMYPRSPAYHYVGRFPIFAKTISKNFEISYRVNLGEQDSQRRQIRQAILDKLMQSSRSQSVDTNYQLKDISYSDYLAQVLISVCPPGHGAGTFRHLETLKAKSLMFSHDSIDDIQLLPNAKLIEGEDYISFNLDNLAERLDQLFADRENIQRIAQRGYQKFTQGYSVPRSAMGFYRVLRDLI